MDERWITHPATLKLPDIILVWDTNDLATKRLQGIVDEILARDSQSVSVYTKILYKKASESGQPSEVTITGIVGDDHQREIWKSSTTIIPRDRPTDSGEHNPNVGSTAPMDSDRESTSVSTGSGETDKQEIDHIIEQHQLGICNRNPDWRHPKYDTFISWRPV